MKIVRQVTKIAIDRSCPRNQDIVVSAGRAIPKDAVGQRTHPAFGAIAADRVADLLRCGKSDAHVEAAFPVVFRSGIRHRPRLHHQPGRCRACPGAAEPEEIGPFLQPADTHRPAVRPTASCGPWPGGDGERAHRQPSPYGRGSHDGAYARACSVGMYASRRYLPKIAASRRPLGRRQSGAVYWPVTGKSTAVPFKFHRLSLALASHPFRSFTWHGTSKPTSASSAAARAA